MVEKEYELPSDKRRPTIFFIVMIVLSVGLLALSVISFYDYSVPEDLIQITCEFNTYETKQRTRSTSYDLLLFSEEYDKPFKLPFFDGYKKQYSPEAFCDGSTYIVSVAPYESSYVIYSCSDVDGNLIMTKREAYINSQSAAHYASSILFSVIGCFFILLLLIIHYPDKFGVGVKKLFFGKR